MTSDIYPGDRVKYKNAEGQVKARGVEKGVRYIQVTFDRPMRFSKFFRGDDIKKLKKL